MKLSINWLKDYVDPKLSTDELAERLTMAGLEVEDIHSIGQDTVFDLEITPNRPDCLNTIGLAREISAITAKNLKLPKVKVYKAAKTRDFAITIQDKKDCGRYIGTLIRNADVDQSEGWMAERLAAVGIRPISNAVDITNFVLMEMGQPLHVFDFDKLAGGKIIVRRAAQGERIVTLDGIERKLDPSILVIADAEKPVAIAGIMGGLDTAVTETTTNILLESAHFDMGLIRRAGRTLGLKSDSSYRFERGVDAGGVLAGADRAADLLCAMTGGTVAGRTDQSAGIKTKAAVIHISIAEITALLGTDVSAAQVKSSLTRLGLTVAAGKAGAFKVGIPGFRGDLKQKVDVIEEIARVIGYDRLDSSFPHIQVLNIPANSRPRQVRECAAQVLTAQGFSEVITFSLISRRDLDKSNLSHLKHTGLINALSQEHSIMRPSMLPSMLKVAETNVNRGQRELRLFEIGKRYAESGKERAMLAILAAGRREQDWRTNAKGTVDLFDVKGILEQFFCRQHLKVCFEAGPVPGLDSRGSSQILSDKKAFGALGKVDPAVLAQWDIKAGDLYYAEVDLECLYHMPAPAFKYHPVPEYPAINRDVSIAVRKDIPYAQIARTCCQLGGDMLKHVHLIEEYTGDKIQPGCRGLVFSLTYQANDRTLREDEVNTTHHHILLALTKEFGVIQR